MQHSHESFIDLITMIATGAAGARIRDPGSGGWFQLPGDR